MISQGQYLINSAGNYVYYIVPNSGNKIREMAFIKFDEIDKKHAKTLHLALIEKGADEYIIELDFVY
jgi:hypothetical protein